MGPHAGESEDDIFKRKIEDIDRTGLTFWLIRSYQAKPNMVQAMCKEAKNDVYAIFVEASSIGGAKPTKTAESAKGYSEDRIAWKNMPEGLGPVTGRISSNAFALLFNQLQLTDGEIDLWDYADFFSQDEPLKIYQGASTMCAVKKDMSSHANRIKSNHRRIVAVGKLCEPFCVWLK